MLVTQMLYVKDPLNSYFFTPDSRTYYSRFVQLANFSKYTGPTAFDLGSSSFLYKGVGIYYLGWFLGRMSVLITGNHSITIHLIVVVWCASMINAIIYQTLLLYFKKTIALSSTLFYAIFSYSLIFSATLLRDMHVAFFLALGCYVLHKQLSRRTVFQMIIIIIFIFLFRPSHALFFLSLIIYRILNNYKVNKVIYLLFFIFVGILFFGLTIVGNHFGYLNQFLDWSESYQEFHVATAQQSDGGANFVYSLIPRSLYPFARILQSQINPFSLFWIYKVPENMANGEFPRFQLLTYAYSIANLFWFVVIGFFFMGIVIRKYRSKIPKRIFEGAVGSIFLLILAGYSSNDVRRLLGVYPSMFVCSVYVYNALLAERNRKNIIKILIIVYISIAVTYAVVKIFI
ncbi:hypothetical protein [Pleomorphochaeta sp. DL1XJH-081]|uniref:hypothetical protein n=1 Tax=Pleomorphochaeta sp. DL1XJH-081 TaxID=3409690 RepID=UPI003BB514D2